MAIPGTAGYAQATNLAKRAYEQALARINNQRGSFLRKAGYQADFDPVTGVAKNVRVDATNPYGTYQGMRRSHALQDEMVRASAIDRGLGSGGGLAAQLANQARYEFGREDSEFGSALLEGLQTYQDEHTSAKFDYDRALYEAELEAAREAAAAQAFTPVYDGGGGDWELPDLSGGGSPEDIEKYNRIMSQGASRPAPAPAPRTWQMPTANSGASTRAAKAADQMMRALPKSMPQWQKALMARSAGMNAFYARR